MIITLVISHVTPGVLTLAILFDRIPSDSLPTHHVHIVSLSSAHLVVLSLRISSVDLSSPFRHSTS